MHRRQLIAVPSLFALLLPNARRASATPPEAQVEATDATATVATAETVVDARLVKPLTEKEAQRNRFSRTYIPPQARRLRVLDREPSTDGPGAEFVAFAVDERSGRRAAREDDDAGWRKGDEVFVKRGDKFFAVGLLLGRRTAAADDGVCRPVPTPTALGPAT